MPHRILRFPRRQNKADACALQRPYADWYAKRKHGVEHRALAVGKRERRLQRACVRKCPVASDKLLPIGLIADISANTIARHTEAGPYFPLCGEPFAPRGKQNIGAFLILCADKQAGKRPVRLVVLLFRENRLRVKRQRQHPFLLLVICDSNLVYLCILVGADSNLCLRIQPVVTARKQCFIVIKRHGAALRRRRIVQQRRRERFARFVVCDKYEKAAFFASAIREKAVDVYIAQLRIAVAFTV